MQFHILLGGNLGNREENFTQAKKHIEEKIGSILKMSSIYETKAWGVENQPDFLNQVILVETSFLPEEVLQKNLEIEKILGRVRHQKWHERTIDIDILYAENLIIDQENLQLPHPFIQDRKFTTVPLSEISPDFIHPIFEKNQAQLNQECQDNLPVYLYQL